MFAAIAAPICCINACPDSPVLNITSPALFSATLTIVPPLVGSAMPPVAIAGGCGCEALTAASCSADMPDANAIAGRLYGHGAPVAATWIARAPVSYTHLRAHETKANLVCRLLLEKKKES